MTRSPRGGAAGSVVGRVAIALFGAASVALSTQVQAQATAAAPAAHTDAALADWLRTAVPRLMKRLDVPGVVVDVVHHDRTVLHEAFGFADVARHRRGDSTTLFRVASVSKIFTALAVLQLVEAGSVGLQQDLRPLVPDILHRSDIDAPVTLHQLLTHTAGFDEQLMGYVNPAGAAAMPLAQFLQTSLPQRSRPPSDVPAYSNHGYGLAGLVVERLARRPFDQYARDEVFRPRGMSHTQFLLEPRDLDAPDVSLEYRSDGVREVPRSTRAYPAGNVGTTGGDMNAFLRWMLTALKDADTTSSAYRVSHRLVGPMLRYHADLPAMGYGLSGVPLAGRTVWMKGGAAPRHSAVVAVIPELDVAIFIALNRQEPLLWDWLLTDLVQTFWRVPERPGVADSLAAGRVASPDGTYRWTRVALGSSEKVLGLAAQLVVRSTRTGISVSGPQLGGEWRRLGAVSFANASGSRMVFRAGAAGRASFLFSILQGQPVSFERIAWYESTRFQLSGCAIAVLLSLVGAVAAVRFRRRVRPALVTPRWASASVIALPLLQAGLAVTVLVMLRGLPQLLTGPTAAFRTTLVLSTAMAIVGLLQAAGAVVLATRTGDSRSRCVASLCAAAGGLFLAWFLTVNHLVGVGG